MAALTYVTGDATLPHQKPGESAVIAHVTNNRGGWGKGFVLALSGRYPGVAKAWRQSEQGLGDVFVDMVHKQAVAHLCAQDGYASAERPCVLDYEALECCLETLVRSLPDTVCFGDNTVVVHMPRMGCGLAGGEWSRVAELVEKHIVASGYDVHVYDLP